MGKLKSFFGAVGRYKYTITIVLFLLIICFLDQNNMLLRVRHKQQIRSLKEEIGYYENVRDESVRGLEELMEDEGNMERIARENYGMHLPDEEVFIIQ